MYAILIIMYELRTYKIHSGTRKRRTEQLRWTDYINTACIESGSKSWVTLLAQNMFILFWESEHPKQSFHLTPRATSYICTVHISKLTATCIYTACFDSLSTESNILTRVMYVHALLSSEAELPLIVHATNEVLYLQCSKMWLHLAVHIMHNKIATDGESVDMWRVSNDSVS